MSDSYKIIDWRVTALFIAVMMLAKGILGETQSYLDGNEVVDAPNRSADHTPDGKMLTFKGFKSVFLCNTEDPRDDESND